MAPETFEMSSGLRVEFTVERERARRAAIVRRVARVQLGHPLGHGERSPTWALGAQSLILCGEGAIARAVERELARKGGAWVSVLDWDALLDALEGAAGLPRARVAHEASRVAAVEQALLTLSAEPSLAEAMSVDPSSVARALCAAADVVRSCGWHGERSVIDEACEGLSEAVVPPVRAHLTLVAEAVRVLEAAMDASGESDRVRRIERWLAAPMRSLPRSWRELVVEGVDALSPVERTLLEAIADAGVRVDVAPWVFGWRRSSPRPVVEVGPPATTLEALARFPLGERCAGDDGAIEECFARDPEDEAEAVAQWLASMQPEQRAGVAIVVPGEAGDGARVLRALAAHGVEGAYRGAVRAVDVPLWNVVRSALRLAWRGVSVIDLAAVLSAPGSGTWGSDRDRVVARLRSRAPSRWSDVRAAILECTDPTQHAFVLATDGRAERVFDESRAAALEAQRQALLALVSELEGASPMSALDAPARLARVRAVLEQMLTRFANPQRIQASVRDPRAASLWVACASAIREASRAVLAALERDPRPLSSAEPTPLLLRIERMLPALSDAVGDRRARLVRVLCDGEALDERPDTLVVLGFAAGRYPRAVASLPWLGPTERAALARTSLSSLAELRDEGTSAQIAARRAHRVLASPTRRLVLVHTRRASDGSPLDPSATRADVLDALEPSLAEAKARRALRHIRAVLPASEALGSARRRALVERIGAAPDHEALDGLEAHLREHSWDEALFAARLAPSRDFALASVLRPLIATATYSPADLELSTKCRFAFATRAVLGLRWLPLETRRRWGPRSLVLAAHRALRALDATTGDVERALDAALEEESSRGARLETAGARRVLRGFVRRFGAQRARWSAKELPRPEPPEGDETPAVHIDLPCEHGPRSIAVRADLSPIYRVAKDALGESRSSTSTKDEVGMEAREEPEPSRTERREGDGLVLVELRLGRVDDDRARRALAIGAASAVLPAVAEASVGEAIDGLVTVSLNRGEQRTLTREGGASERSSDEAPATLEAVAMEAKRRFAAAFDAIVAGEEPVAPHDHARRKALEDAGLRSCEGCPSRLLCRFALAGETE